MAQIQEHIAACTTPHATLPRQRGHRAPQNVDAHDELLNAIRRGLARNDPIAELLAQLRAADEPFPARQEP